MKDINPGSDGAYLSNFTVMGDKLFFNANDGTHGAELWISDGTETGTQLLKDINPGSDGSDSWGFTEVGDKLFFRANDGTHGAELWVSDGTETGTQLLKDINPGSDDSFIYTDHFPVVGDKLFFRADDGNHGAELWVSDGTEAGTQLLKDISGGTSSGLGNSSYRFEFTVWGDKLFFRADDGTHGWELWVSDGTEAGTHLFKDINPGGSDSFPGNFAVVGDKLFFAASDSTHGWELWVSDGTEAGTQLVKDINLGSNGSSFEEPTVMGDKLFFTADDGTHGQELWMYVNEAPTAVSLDSNRVDENAATGTVIGNLTTTDPDSFDTHTYTLLNDAGGRFAVSGNQIVVADGTLIDRETIDSHSIRVQTTDPEGLSYEQNFTINVNNINEAPEMGDQSFEIAEDATDGTTVGTVTSSDVDGPTLTYSITAGNDDGIFTINGITGEITVLDSTQLDFETTDSYNLTVEVTDTEHQTSATVTVSITDANDAPEIGDQSFEVAEDAIDGTSVGTVATSDADGDSLTYSITAGNGDGIFAIDESTGEITLADSTQLDFETAESYNLSVQIDDGEYQTSAAVTVNLTDVNETPEFTSTAPTSATQDIPYTYNIVIEDPDAGETLTITAPTLPDWLTLTDKVNGTATLSGTPDNEQVGDHTVELQVEDQAGEIHTQSFTLRVKNTNDAPTLAGTPDTTVDEDSSYSFTPDAEDLDGDTLSFSIKNKPGWATFSSATGKLSGTPQNKDVGTTENIVISVTDGTETVALNAFSLEVINTNDVPKIGDQNFSIAEDAPRGIVVGTVVASDADGDSLIYSIIEGNDDGVFAIAEKTGEITVSDNSKLDFEAIPNYRLTVKVSDQETGESATVTVGITNVNEAPETINLSHLSIPENSPENTIVGTLSTADPDNSDSHTYKLIDDADGRFKLSGKTLVVNQGDKLDYETDTSHTITIKTTDRKGLSYEQELVIAVEDGIINSESELEEYLSDRRISGLPKGMIGSMFDLFEVGESDPENTPTAAIEFEKVSTVGGDKQQQISLTSVKEYPISLTPLLDVLSQVPSYSFSTITSLLDDLGVSIALTEPTLTISNLDTVAVYEISTQVEIPDGEDNFLGFIKDTLRVDELVLKAGINSDNYHPYIAASLDLDDITIFELDDFMIDISGADLLMETDLKGEPSVSIIPKLKLSNYDPFQSDEPPLELLGLFTFEPESITAGFMLAPEEVWKNPLGIPDTEIRNVALELGVTYAGTGLDNFNVIGDVKFGKFDIASALAVDVNDPNKNGIILTVNQPVNLLDLWMGPVTSYVLNTIYEPIKPLQSTLEFLRKIVDINIESIDTDNDGDLDPLIKVLPEPKSIAGTTLQTGLAINGKLTAWGADATLKIEGNPYNLDNVFQGELLLSPIDLGFIEILGAKDPNLSLNIGINLDEQYLRGDARLKMFGKTVAQADVEVTLSGFTIKDFDVDLGLVGFDIDNLSINWSDRTAKGRGQLEVLGRSVGILDFATDSNSITIKDFDVDLGLVALDVDDFYLNWKNSKAQGQGEIEILGQSVGRLDFEADSKSLTIKDFYRDFGVVALDVDDLYFNWVNKTARGKGELELLGQTIANTDFSMNSSSLTIKDFDVDLGVVALDVDDLSVNWKNNTASGSGGLELFGQTIADADFSMTSSSLTINDFDIDLGLIALDTDKLSVNLKNQSASFKAGVEIFGQRISSVDVTLSKDKVTVEDWSIGFGNLLKLQIDKLTVDASGLNGSGIGKIVLFGQTLGSGSLKFKDGNLTVSGTLGVDVLDYDIDLNVDITVGSDIRKIDISFEFLGSNYTLISDSVDNFARKYTSKSSLSSVAGDIVWEVIGDIPRHLENLIKEGINSIENVGNLVIETASKVASIVSDKIESLLEGDFKSFIDGKPAPPTEYYGDNSGNKKDGEDNSDILFGNGGNDTLHGHLRPDLIDGGSGNDSLLGGNDNDTINGGDGDDEIFGQGHADLIYGWAGNDKLQGAGDKNQYNDSDQDKREDRDTIHGGLGNDIIWGEMGNDWLYGDAGNDTLDGGEHDDRLSGGPGKDYFDGGSGSDIVDYSYATVDIKADFSAGKVDVPGEGTETIKNIEGIVGGSGNDFISVGIRSYVNGGPGNDTADFSDALEKIDADLTSQSVKSSDWGDFVAQKVYFTNSRDQTYDAYMNSIENIIGGIDNDILRGNSGKNYLNGGPGDDRLFGGSGDDILDAGSGVSYDESLFGEDGNDVLIVSEFFDGTYSGGEGTDILVLEGSESDYTFTELNWLETEITSPSHFGKITVMGIEEFQYGQYSPPNSSNGSNAIDSKTIDYLTKWYSSLLGSVIDGYIAAGKIFFDVNLNGILDEDEPYAFTEVDGSFDLDVDLDQYDRNQNGVIEYTEGKIIVNDGIDTSTGLTLDTPLSSLPEFTVVTPLTTIIAELVTQSDPETAQALVKAAVGLLADIDLSNYDPLEAIAHGDANGATVFGKMIQVQNIIVQTAKFVGAGSELPLSQVANGAIASIAQQFSGGQPVDLSNPETITAIISSTVTAMIAADSNINAEQLMNVAATAAEVMALGNQIIDELLASGASLTDLATDIARLQAVSVGQVAVDLPELATGQITPEEFLAANTVEAIQAKVAEAIVNDPTVRQGIVEITLDNLENLEGTGENTDNPTDNGSGSSRTGSSNEQFIGSVVGSGTFQSSNSSDTNPVSDLETSGFDPTVSIPEIISPVQPTMPEMTTSVTEATVESDLIMGNGIEPMYLLDGHDTLVADDEDNWVNGNVGNDMIDVSAGNDTVYGGQDNDTIFGSAGNDWINGNKGADFLEGGEGIDTLYGGEDSDTLQGNAGDDWLSGNKGADFLDGGDGVDILFGGQDGDTLQGGADNDELFGNVGVDLLEGNDGNDLLHGGQSDDTLSGNSGDDTVHGDRGNDLLDGNVGNDILNGGEGDDTLDGGEGDDQLMGDAGDDVLFGAVGNDTLTGGEGSDRFILTAVSGSNLITDFTDGEDLIVLEDGLTFEQLTLEDSQNATIVKFNEEILATLNGVESGLMTAGDFVNSL